jgi:hypothetical protein
VALPKNWSMPPIVVVPLGSPTIAPTADRRHGMGSARPRCSRHGGTPWARRVPRASRRGMTSIIIELIVSRSATIWTSYTRTPTGRTGLCASRCNIAKTTALYTLRHMVAPLHPGVHLAPTPAQQLRI